MTRRLSTETETSITANPVVSEPGSESGAKTETRTDKLVRSVGLDPATFFDQDLPSGYFSHSQYDAYKNCGMAYKFRYVEKIQTPPSAVMGRGSALHAVYDKVLSAKRDKQVLPVLSDMRDLLRDSFEKATENVEKWSDDEDAETPMTKNDHQKLVLDAFDVFYTHALPKLNPIAVEKGFATKFAGVPYIGFIDMIDEVPAIQMEGMSEAALADVPKNKVVVDHKTTRSTWAQSKADTHPQLTLYAAVENTPHVRIDQLVMLKRGPAYRPLNAQRTNDDIEILREDAEDVIQHIKDGDFPMTQIGAWNCSAKRCGYWHMCRGKARK